MMDIERIIIDIDCYNCGENISIPFQLNGKYLAYAYCKECREGVEIQNEAGTLSITRVRGE